MEFTSDFNTHYLDTQYMFGDALLVAPIMNESGKGHYYLPEGQWTHFFTHESIRGGKWISEDHDYFSLPLLVRENTILPLGHRDDDYVYPFDEAVELRVYHLKDNRPATRIVYDMAGEERLRITIEKIDQVISIQLSAVQPCSVTLIGQAISEKAEHISFDGLDTRISFAGNMTDALFTFHCV